MNRISMVGLVPVSRSIVRCIQSLKPSLFSQKNFGISGIIHSEQDKQSLNNISEKNEKIC